MAPDLDFRYFRSAGVPLTIRMLVKYGDLEFEDVRLETQRLFSAEESNSTGQIFPSGPLFHGGAFEDSVATARYVARKVKLTGENHWENLEIDAIVDTIGDLLMKIQMYAGEQNPGRKQVLKDKLFDEVLPFYFGRLDKIAAANGGHLALGKLTWADFYFASLERVFRSVVDEKVLDGYANLKILIENVPEIAPVTP